MLHATLIGIAVMGVTQMEAEAEWTFTASGPRTPLVAALSTDEGRTWSEPKAIEADLSAHYAYTSIRFHKDRALFSYYVARGGLLSLKFKSIPLAWFRE